MCDKIIFFKHTFIFLNSILQYNTNFRNTTLHSKRHINDLQIAYFNTYNYWTDFKKPLTFINLVEGEQFKIL